MTEDPSEGWQDRSRIDIDQEQDLLYWMEELGVDEQTLRDTVANVGDRADEVRAAIRYMKQLMAKPIQVWPRTPEQ